MAKTHDYESASHWLHLHIEQFAKESDRASVILTAALFDNTLGQYLRSTLVASPTEKDELLDGPNGPASSFSSRINLAYRIGLISARFCRDLHLIRAIRNSFAHNITGCSFNEGSVHSRVMELAKSSGIIERIPKLRGKLPKGPRNDFQIISSWMLYALNKGIEACSPIKEAPIEWGYDESQDESTTEPNVKKEGNEKP